MAKPIRVVSLAPCTDQLALLVAQPGQLIAISSGGRDPAVSAMAMQAQDIPTHDGDAATILALDPDLVLAGDSSPAPLLAALRRAGLRVKTVADARTLHQIPENLRDMGALLQNQPQVQTQIWAFHDRLGFLTRHRGPDPVAAMVLANGRAVSEASLPGQILRAAGFRNLTQQLGLPQGGLVPLPQVIAARPDLLILGLPGPAAMPPAPPDPAKDDPPRLAIPESLWRCGTPKVLDALHILVQARHQIVLQGEYGGR